MAKTPKEEVVYRIDTAAEASLYGFAGFMDVLTAIPGANIIFAPISPLVMGIAFWGNGVSPFERKVAGKLATIALWKVVPFVSMFPANTRTTFAIIQWSRFEDRHSAIKKTMKLYATYRALEKTDLGKKLGGQIANSSAGQAAGRAGQAVANSRLGQNVANNSRFQGLMQGERAFGEDFTMKDVRPGVKAFVHPSGLSKSQREQKEREEKGDVPIPGGDTDIAQYRDLANAARDLLTTKKPAGGDIVDGIKRGSGRGLSPEVIQDAFNDEEARHTQLAQTINDAKQLVEDDVVDGIRPGMGGIADTDAVRAFEYEKEKQKQYGDAATAGATSVGGGTIEDAQKRLLEKEQDEKMREAGLDDIEEPGDSPERPRPTDTGFLGGREPVVGDTPRDDGDGDLEGLGGKPIIGDEPGDRGGSVFDEMFADGDFPKGDRTMKPFRGTTRDPMDTRTVGDDERPHAPLREGDPEARKIKKLADDIMDGPLDAQDGVNGSKLS